MESLEINIAAFINPHCFFITDADSQHRSTFLHDLSARIKRSHMNLQNGTLPVDEIVAVHYQTNLVRATVLEKAVNEESNLTLYHCWLIDYAVLIKTDKIFILPREIQKITPRAKQACLNNFCYLKEQLELGVTGHIKTVPSIFPSAGVTQICLDLLQSGYSKLVFEVAERCNNILIGEVVIHKSGDVLYLSKELCNRSLITIDELIFQRIKYNTKDYVKMNLETIHQVCKTQKIGSSVPEPDSNTSFSPRPDHVDLEELDIENLQVIENGRHRRAPYNKSLNSSYTSGSEDDCSQKKSHNKTARLLAKLKQARKMASETGYVSEPVVEAPKVHNKSLLDMQIQSHLDLQNKQVYMGKKPESDLDNKHISSSSTAPIQAEVTAPIVSSSDSSKSDVLSRSKAARALQIIKERKALEAARVASEEKSAVVSISATRVKSTTEDLLKKLNASRLNRRCMSSCSTEGLNTSEESSFEEMESTTHSNQPTEEKSPSSDALYRSEPETKKSPFGDITSQRKSKPLGLFLPAGMESSYNKMINSTPKKASKTTKASITNPPLSKIPSTATPHYDDCPTIKIPKNSGNLTDDQFSAEEKIEDKEKETISDSPPEVFTKQDFCRLVTGCTCVKCRLTLDDDDWDAPLNFAPPEGEKKKKSEFAGPVIRPPKLLKKETEDKTSVQDNEILSIDYSGMSTMEKRMSCKVLVHGESIPNPIKRVANVNIHRDIYNSINRLNYKEAKRIQHYAFPAITRNQHVFMVNNPGSGKTMAYLPILSSFVMEKEERYSKLLKMSGGPIVVILCSNSKKCEEVYDLTKLIFDRQRNRVNLVTYPGRGNISNIDILITMPTILQSLISSRATNFKRLCHFVLEDGDVILKSHHELIKKFLDYGDQVLTHRHCPKSIQIILCAEHWTPQIEDLLKKLNKVPMVCIGNHLQAALYGRIKFAMKCCDSASKEQNLEKILHDVYKFTKSIIICNPDEIEDIMNFLPLKGIEFTAMTDKEEEDINYKEVSWSNAVPGKYSVLICTDDMYNTINVTSAQLLVHYSLPRSWTQFMRRFSCFLENNATPLNIEQRKESTSTYVFIDENCEPRMSKFVNFYKISGFETLLPGNIKEYFKAVVEDEEKNRVARRIELCEVMRIFGKCHSTQCKKRHILDKEVDHSDILPQNGTINFRILKMTSTTTCSIKLLEHFDLQGRSVEKFEDYTDAITEIIAKKDGYFHVSELKKNHLYLHKDGDAYYRCKLLEMDEFSLVYLIDRGIYCKSALSRLFKMPESLKNISQQCYEVHFANLIPPHGDTKFSRSAKHKAQFLVDSNCLNSTMTARITFQAGNNLWLEDVCEVREMHDKSLPSIGYQLSRELVKQEIAVRSEKPLAYLYSLSRAAGIDLPDYRVAKPAIKQVIVEQVKPQWAFFDMDAINQVQFSCGISPGEFYLKHQRFDKELTQLEEAINKEILKPFYPIPQKIEAGKCYLVKDEPTGVYSRCLVLKVTVDHAHVFCVDYADDLTVPLLTLKHISNDMISKLPFQSIQCSMYGIKPVDDEWNDEATELLYKMGFEDDSDIFRTLFVKAYSKQPNQLIPSQNSYSVIVKDGFSERHLLLNELLVDCGFAVPSGEEIRDFELPRQAEESEEEEEIEEIIRSDVEVEVEHDRQSDGSLLDESAFDFAVFDMKGMMELLNIPTISTDDKKAIEERKTEDDLPPMRAVPSVDYLTPEVHWSQTESKIKLSIRIPDVQEPYFALKHNRILQFRTEKDGKKYYLKLMFYEKVEKTFKPTTLGQELRVLLTKCQNEEWPRLLHTQEKMKNIRFDATSIKVDEKIRRMLQLDISDSSSDDDENDRMYYHVCSDLDSEYDYDIPNDEE